jgi:ElaB/YqjD/DUF883 family membrane-anchored ribosome-binding protein
VTTTTNEQIEREINFLVDPEIKYVSIVSRGANGVPFKIVKNLDGENMQKVLHSIIAPKGTDPNDIKKLMGEDLESIVKLDSGMESGSHVTFVQQPRESFKADSLELFDIDKEKGIKGLRGLPVVEEKGLIGKLFAKQQEVIFIDDSLESQSKEDTVKYMSWELHDELEALEDAIEGILSQEAGDPQAKIEMVNAVMANFIKFVGDVITVTKGEALKIEKRGSPANTPAEEIPVEENTPVEPAVVEKSVDEIVTEKLAEVTKSFKEELASAMKELTESLTAKMEENAKKVDETAEAVSKMAEMVPGEVTDTREDRATEPTQKGDVFSGLLFSTK